MLYLKIKQSEIFTTVHEELLNILRGRRQLCSYLLVKIIMKIVYYIQEQWKPCKGNPNITQIQQLSEHLNINNTSLLAVDTQTIIKWP